MAEQPTLTPIAAQRMMGYLGQKSMVVDDWTYLMDQVSEFGGEIPIAVPGIIKPDEWLYEHGCWCPDGEPGDPITDKTVWVDVITPR